MIYIDIHRLKLTLTYGALNRNVIMDVASLCNLQKLYIVCLTELLSKVYKDAFQQGCLVNLRVDFLISRENIFPRKAGI